MGARARERTTPHSLPATGNNVREIMRSVREGIRTEDDLFKCACPACRVALQTMWENAVLQKLKAVKP